MGYWRSFVRKRMKPVDLEYAKKMRNRFSALYFLAAWNIFGYGIYLLSKQGTPTKEDEEPTGKYYSKILGFEKMKVYHFKGTELVDEFTTPARVEMEPEQPVKNSKSDEKTLPNEDLKLLVEETDSL